MEYLKKFAIIGLCLSIVLGITACKQSSQSVVKETLYSNMANKESMDEVKNSLKACLDAKSIDNFIAGVDGYNKIAGEGELAGNFKKFNNLKYNIDKINESWTRKRVILLVQIVG